MYASNPEVMHLSLKPRVQNAKFFATEEGHMRGYSYTIYSAPYIYKSFIRA